jgi:pimeloyl-ACP methyl ester carboxylesterase
MEAALAWTRTRSARKNARVLLWGSSYSAALAFLLAAEYPEEVAGVLAFSPNEYLDGPHAVHSAAAKVSVPIFVTSAKDREEIAAAKSILDVDGSSTLRADRNRSGEGENWQAVEQFLNGFESKE